MSLLLRENDSNGIEDREETKAPHFGCIGHSLHLVVGPLLLEKSKKRRNEEEFVKENEEDDDIEEYELLDEEDDYILEEVVNQVHHIVSKFRKFSKYIKNSPKAKEKIEQVDLMAKSNNCDTINIALYMRTL